MREKYTKIYILMVTFISSCGFDQCPSISPWRIPFSSSYKVVLLAMNSLSFYLFGNVLIFFFVLNKSFAVCRIFGWQFFFTTWNMYSGFSGFQWEVNCLFYWWSLVSDESLLFCYNEGRSSFLPLSIVWLS